MKKRLIACLLSAAMILSLAACGSKTNPNPNSPSSPGNPQETNTPKPVKDSLSVAYEVEPSNLNPQGNNQIAAYYITYLLYSGLFKNTVNGVEKDLISDYTVENDTNGEGTIWVFTLRQDAKFSDGSALTAADVAATLNAAKESSIKANASFYSKAEADGDYTVKLYTNGVYSAVPEALANKMFYIMPAKLLESGHDFDNNPIGSGPYKLVQWKKGEAIIMTANEHYYGGAPAIKDINWKIMAEGTSRTISLEAGEVDFVISVDPLDVERLKSNSEYNVSITNGSMYTYLALQNSKAPFSDINFRKFLSAAIDRDAVIDVALDGYGTPLASCINVNIDGYTDEGAVTHDPAKAKEYLAAWGGDPGSVSFEIVVATDVRRRMAEVIQSNLLEYGITTEVVMNESATVSSRAASGDFETLVFAYTTNYFMAYANQLYVNNKSYAGYMMGNVDRFDADIKMIASELDANVRKGMITELNKKINEYQPNIPIYCSQVILGYDADIKGVEVDSMGFFRVEEFSWN